MNWVAIDTNDYIYWDGKKETMPSEVDPQYIVKMEGGWDPKSTGKQFLEMLKPLYPHITFTGDITEGTT